MPRTGGTPCRKSRPSFAARRKNTSRGGAGTPLVATNRLVYRGARLNVFGIAVDR